MGRKLQFGLLLGVVIVLGIALAPVPIEAAVAASVRVVNPPSEPVPVVPQGTWVVRNADERGRQPYQQQANVYSNTAHMASGTITIPAGKRLVVEYISAYCGAPGPAVVALHKDAGLYNAGVFVAVDKVRNSEVPGGWKMYFGGEMIRYFGEGELLVNVYVDAGFPWNAYVNVIGYLVDLP